MTDNLEVLCLEGLEKALIGYQMNADSNLLTLVYDYDATLELLRQLGYGQSEIVDFLEEIRNIDFVSPPVFVRLDEKAKSNVMRCAYGDRYYFDDDKRTIHWRDVEGRIWISYAIYGTSSRWIDDSAGKIGAIYM